MSRPTVKKHEIDKAKILFHPVQSICSYIFGDSLT